jgi:hypothetical protein
MEADNASFISVYLRPCPVKAFDSRSLACIRDCSVPGAFTDWRYPGNSLTCPSDGYSQ